MTTHSPFRYVFWGLVVLAAISMMGAASMVGGRWMGCGGPVLFHPGPLIPMSFLVFVYIAVTGWLVHRDASKRGMDPWLWATVAAFVPYFIGVIIYLVVSRTRAGTACSNCGESLRSDFRVCPHCGHARERLCEKCQKPLDREWKVCPYCGHSPGTQA